MNQILPRILALACLVLLGAARSSAIQVVISEVMYQPINNKPEYIEISNVTATPLDMARWNFTNGITYIFPDFNAGSNQAHFLKQFERIIVSSADEATTRAAYTNLPPGVRVFGPWTSGALSNSGERITLADKNGVVVATLEYADSGKWPVAPDGTGHSLVLTNENRDPDDWRFWRTSTNNGGSPGLPDPAPPAVGLALNEVHFNNLGQVDWIELRNNSPTTTQPATGLFLASTLNFSNKVALSGNLTPGAVASYPVTFAADSEGSIRLFLIDSANNVRDSVLITRRPGRDSWQVFPAGSREWYNDTTPTQDAQNNPTLNTSIVINEIMADPPSNQRDGEFIELYNKGASAVNVGGWTLDDDVNFTIPPGTMIPSGGYLVIAANATWLNSQYTGLAAIGSWSGSLNNNGDRLRLEDANGNLVDEVDFRFGGEWPGAAGGDGSSLELTNPDADNSLGGAWRDSDESAKSTFQSVTINGGNYIGSSQAGTDHEIRIWTTGDSHIVMKNFVIRPTSGSGNQFTNAEVTTLNNENNTGWQSRGTHAQTFHDSEGVHLVADGGGDNKCNHMEKAAALSPNVPYTMTFDARWVSGSPRLVVQSWDLTWGGIALVPIPNNLGTPGAQNSRFVANPPPQVTGLGHFPLTPTTSQTITISARVSSASPIANVQLWHRLDNITASGVWNNLAMADNGLNGDVRAGDGIYTAQINPASFSGYGTLGAIIQYYVRATADNGQIAELPRGGASIPGMWVVDNNVPATDLRRIRVVISAYWGNALSQDSPTGGHTVTYNYKYPKLSNRYFPCITIINDSEIYYDSGVHKTGSPFTRGNSNVLDRGRVTLPGDKPFRGKGRIYWDNDSASGNMLHNRVHRYLMYLLGVPSNENEVCRVAKNNVSYAVRETNEVFDGDMLNRLYPDGNSGTFFEMDDRFWIADDGSTRLGNNDGSWDYKVGDSQGTDNPTAYHNQFTPQSREEDYDYSAFLGWCQQLELPPNAEILERIADTKAMTAYAAIRAYSADWDNMTINRGKNGYFYNRPTDHKWMMLHWDSDLSFRPEDVSSIPVIGGMINVGTYYGRPTIRRFLNYYLNEMITTYASNGTRMGAWITAENNASPSYVVPSTYATWPTLSGGSGTRHDVIRNFIGTTSLNAPFVTTFPANGSTVTANTVTVSGTAPALGFNIICVGHPEAVLAWTGTSSTNTSPWSMSNIQLRSGLNVLTFRMLNLSGAQVGSDITININKTGDAAPVVVLDVTPSSQNVELGEAVTLSAINSYDPELAGPLTYSWTITPNTGFAITAPSAAERVLTFTTPGSYTVSLQATDVAGSSTTSARVLSVHAASGFDAFNSNFLTGYTLENLELRDNSSSLAWYSLNETNNNLVINLTGVSSMPVRAGTPTFPLVTRSLPPTADCLLQTDLTLESWKSGSAGAFITGLYLETTEGGVLTRYLFGVDAGTTYKVWRSAGGAAYTQAAAVAYSGGDIALRIQRTGTNIQFQRKGNGVWAAVHTQAVAAGTTFDRGGLFASTGLVNSNAVTPGRGLRVAFDYFMIADPESTSDLVGNLRITEIMYNPAGAGGVEFLELRNFGATPLNLNGAHFEDGTPFSAQFTFGSLTLQPGQYCVVTNDPVAFTALYGAGITIAGQYEGSLNNDGEQIVLRDALGNLIHDFSYNDVVPWPLTPDGQGPSLEATVSNTSLYGLGTSWRASYEIGGTPGYKGLAVDSDEDGFSDGMELAYASDPNNAGSSPSLPTTTRDSGNGNVTLTWPSQNGRTYTVQYRNSLTLGAWEPLGNVTATGTTATFTDTTAAGQPQRFYRLATEFP